ncbi:MAG: D-alanyl-D-alanine carboxypeptidase [Clostridiales bacterium]|jgi:D-alanyl-D-alanine carboxypeptidase (penicillin-binding protein 5/6)|nr:D-alanyl-D-alanine carboxypeptidase [Clostridiales bacterium]
MRLFRIFALALAFLIFMGAAKEPQVEAKGAILIEADSGRVLWDKNADEAMAMASTTKIMTAILVLENANLEDIVIVSKRAAAAPRVKMELSAGEEIPLHGLLYALMLQSSNDAAVAIAEHMSGSVAEFCAAMTRKAHELGAIDTVFETPSGLDTDNHRSTAHDMALITRYALQNPLFVEIIATPQFITVSNKKTYDIRNKNRLLNEFEGAFGVKTGFTGRAGHCFVGAAEREGLRLISVVFASGWGAQGKEQKWVDTKRLLNYGFNNFIMEEIVTQGQDAGELGITRSRTPLVALYYDGSLTLPVHKDGENIELVAFFPESVQAPLEAGAAVGEGRIYVNGEYFASIPILTAQAAARHDLKTSMEKVLKNFLQMGTSKEISITLPEF